MADSIYTDVTNVIAAGGYDLADLLHRIDVLYAGGRLTDEEREELVGEACERAEPDAQLPSLTERVGALELRVAALEQGTYQPTEPEGDDATDDGTDPDTPNPDDDPEDKEDPAELFNRFLRAISD